MSHLLSPGCQTDGQDELYGVEGVFTRTVILGTAMMTSTTQDDVDVSVLNPEVYLHVAIGHHAVVKRSMESSI